MFRLLPTLAAVALVGLSAPPALADATATVRALMAQTTGAPIRQVRATGAAPAVSRAVLAETLRAETPERMVRRALGHEAPRVSLRPVLRPAGLMLRFANCRAAPLTPCARPVEPARALSFAADLPAAAPGQVVIVTDGRVRVQTLTR